MISFNEYGYILLIVLYLPYLFMLFLKKFMKKRIYHPHKQLSYLVLISEAGIIFFSLINLFNYGYEPLNDICICIWIPFIFISVIFYYISFIRFFIKKDMKYYYKRFGIIAPIQISKVVAILSTAIFFFNPYVIFFSITYAVFSIIITLKREGE